MAANQDVDFEAYSEELGARIRAFRKERGLTLRDMVVKHNYHESQWRRFERGGASLQSLIRIAKALGTSVSLLLDGIGDFPVIARGTGNKGKESPSHEPGATGKEPEK